MECLYAALCSLFINNLIVSFKPHFKCNYGMNNLLRLRKPLKLFFFHVAGRIKWRVIFVFVWFKENIFL